MKPWAMAALVAVGLFAVSGAGRAQQSDDPDCVFGFGSVPRGAPDYKQFPAGAVFRGAPARPVLDSPEAKTFRTRLRNGAKEGADFAGHFKIVTWGCGTSNQCWAVVDEKSGRVVFDELLPSVWSGHVEDDDAPKPAPDEVDDFSIRWRADSSLVKVAGAPREDESREGVGYYNWTGTHFVLIKQYPARNICRRRRDDE